MKGSPLHRATILNPKSEFSSEPGTVHLRRDTSALMETCSRAGTLSSLWALPIDLWCLVFRVLPKLLCLPPSLLKKFSKDEHVHPPHMELETVVGTSLGLPQDVLEVIFGNLEIPDLYKQSQTPYLFYTSESAGDNVGCLYSLLEKRVYKLTLPEPPIRMVTIEHVKPIFDDSGTIHKFELSYYTGENVYEPPEIYGPIDLREELYFKAFVFPDPSTGSYIVVGEIDAFDLRDYTITRKVIVSKEDEDGGAPVMVNVPEQDDEDGDMLDHGPDGTRDIGVINLEKCQRKEIVSKI
ncbi:hypothetical protein BAE44_0008316, partial [Dichanthelium oligosanthes]